MEQKQRRRCRQAAAVLLGLCLLLAFVVFVWQPSCLILRLTGFYCAGCGGQRMIHALLCGDIAQAFHHNPFLFFALPLTTAYCVWEALRYVRQKPPLYKTRGFLIISAAAILFSLAFMVFRNLPGFEFLGPN